VKGFTPQAMDRLIRYAWPGNVRELMNAVERAVVMTRGEFLAEEDVAPIPTVATPEPEHPAAADARPLEEVEKTTILTILKAADGNKSEAARRLGITRRTLHKKLKAYGVMK
jgi:two-component system response regulator HydG